MLIWRKATQFECHDSCSDDQKSRRRVALDSHSAHFLPVEYRNAPYFHGDSICVGRIPNGGFIRAICLGSLAGGEQSLGQPNVRSELGNRG